MTVTEQWNVDSRQFWLFGQLPESPVGFDDSAGMWNVYGYPEAQHILADPQTFSSDTTRIVPDGKEFSEGSLVGLDPPEHTKLRKLVSHAFTPKVVADLEPRISTLTNELLDEVGHRGRMEMVTELAYPLPVIVIAELLGVPSSDRHLFKQWVDTMFESTQGFSLTNPTEEELRTRDTSLRQLRELANYLREHALRRRTHPGNDLLSKLIESEVDGQRLSIDEVVNFANVLLIAGHITTTMLLGNTILCLEAHPEQYAAVRADRSRVPMAIEESLRFLSPFAAVARVTQTDTEVGGMTIPADQILVLWLAAANRDPRQFTDPEIFDAGRQPNSQLAFGRGVHFCLGAPLARLEGRVALNILLDRFPKLATDPDERAEFIPNPSMTGVRTLPLLLS